MKLTELEKKMLKYTEIRPCVVEDEPDAQTVWLKVAGGEMDAQYFCVTDPPCETRKEAEWMQEMLGLALARIVKESKHGEDRCGVTAPGRAGRTSGL